MYVVCGDLYVQQLYHDVGFNKNVINTHIKILKSYDSEVMYTYSIVQNE